MLPKKNYPETCIFCSNKADSKEHFYGKWLRKHLGAQFRATKHRVRNRQSNGAYILKLGKLNRQGDPYSQSLQVVCNPCNNGWMSGVTNRAMSALKSLIDWRWQNITAEDKYYIAVWAILFSMVVEYDNIEQTVIPQAQRTDFKNTLNPGIGWFVWIAKISDFPTMRGQWHSSFMSELHHGIPQEIYKFTSFIIGNVFFFVLFGTDLENPSVGDLIRTANITMSCIWPNPGRGIGIPSNLIFNNLSYVDIGNTLRRIICPDYAGYMN